MNKQRIQQIIGIVFLLATLMSANNLFAGDRQKNLSSIEQLNTRGAFKIYTRNTSYPDSENNIAAALVAIHEVKSRGLECIAVDNQLIPYGSVIIGRSKQGRDFVGVAVDTGPWVKERKAAIRLAKKLGYADNSPEAKAPVFDFHKNPNLHYWDYFIVIPYIGPDFKFKLDKAKRLAHLDEIKKQFVDKTPTHLLASL